MEKQIEEFFRKIFLNLLKTAIGGCAEYKKATIITYCLYLIRKEVSFKWTRCKLCNILSQLLFLI